MNKDIIEGNWKQLKGKVQQQWGKLTDDDFDVTRAVAPSWPVACRSATALPVTRPRSR